MKKINIYTDGAARGNPGPGGYGVLLEYRGKTKTLSSGYRLTTNNRMELLAVIIGLEAIKDYDYQVVIFSDSKYVVESVNQKWVFNWEKIGFKKKKNPDLWKRFLNIYRKHKVKFIWVKGHAGHERNEICDRLAVEASNFNNLNIDQGYENALEQSKGLFD